MKKKHFAGSNLSGDPKIKNKARLDGETAGFELFPSRKRLGGLFQATAPVQPQKRGSANLANEERLGGETPDLNPIPSRRRLGGSFHGTGHPSHK